MLSKEQIEELESQALVPTTVFSRHVVLDLITILREVEHSRDVLHDSYIRHLEEIEDLKRQQSDLLGTLETLVKESLNDAEGCPNSITLADSVELIKRLKEK